MGKERINLENIKLKGYYKTRDNSYIFINTKEVDGFNKTIYTAILFPNSQFGILRMRKNIYYNGRFELVERGGKKIDDYRYRINVEMSEKEKNRFLNLMKIKKQPETNFEY